VQLKIYNVYNFVLMRNDTIISVIICYDIYDNDNDVFLFFDDFKCVILNVRVLLILIFIYLCNLCLLDANIGTLMLATVVKG
jgi:hypothetical protein